MSLRCAAYARYSSDRQSPASIEDQLRTCREYARTQSWEVLPEYVYTDEELSGAGADRPGWVRLRAAINRKPCPFDILLVDDTSRLCRNLGENSSFTDEARFLGLRVIAVSQGIDTENKQAKVLMAFHGIADEMYIEELSSKTHRGLKGRALKGLSTGGRTYGYDNVPVLTEIGSDGIPARRRQVNENEAAVLRRIFEMCADGKSYSVIAKALNAEHVPPPRKRKGRGGEPSWCPTAIREMLRRELYIGRIVWNRREFRKRPGTNKRVSRLRSEAEWTQPLEVPELRIIDDDLWSRVQSRLAKLGETYNYKGRPGLAHRASTSPNLLTGFLKCGVCGHNLTVVTGRSEDGHGRYGCPINFKRGACSNGVKQRASEIETHLFSELQEAVLRPESINYALKEFEFQLQSSLAGLEDKIGRMRKRAEELKKEIEFGVEELFSLKHNPILMGAIHRRQEEFDEITRQLLGAEPDSISTEIGRIRQFVTGQLGDIRQLLKVDAQKAKAELEKHVTEIRMFPQVDDKKGHYVAEGEWNLLGGYAEAGNPAIRRIRMVAGEGFEPSTFGL
jgi:site-specific DNA recombinase